MVTCDIDSYVKSWEKPFQDRSDYTNVTNYKPDTGFCDGLTKLYIEGDTKLDLNFLYECKNLTSLWVGGFWTRKHIFRVYF
jgi:hypothetical protein